MLRSLPPLHALQFFNSYVFLILLQGDCQVVYAYASVHMRRRHTVVGLCIVCVCAYSVYLCICMSVTRISRRWLKTKHWQMQHRHSAIIS